MGVSLCTPNLSAASVEYGGQDAGKAIGLMSAAMYGSQALFPFVAGVINKAAGPNGVFALFGLAAISVGAVFGLMVIRSEEHTSELQSLMRISYAVFCLKQKITHM